MSLKHSLELRQRRLLIVLLILLSSSVWSLPRNYAMWMISRSLILMFSRNKQTHVIGIITVHKRHRCAALCEPSFTFKVKEMFTVFKLSSFGLTFLKVLYFVLDFMRLPERLVLLLNFLKSVKSIDWIHSWTCDGSCMTFIVDPFVEHICMHRNQQLLLLRLRWKYWAKPHPIPSGMLVSYTLAPVGESDLLHDIH